MKFLVSKIAIESLIIGAYQRGVMSLAKVACAPTEITVQHLRTTSKDTTIELSEAFLQSELTSSSLDDSNIKQDIRDHETRLAISERNLLAKKEIAKHTYFYSEFSDLLAGGAFEYAYKLIENLPPSEIYDQLLLRLNTSKEGHKRAAQILKEQTTPARTNEASRVLNLMESEEDGPARYCEFVKLVSFESGVPIDQLERDLRPFV
jgi:hypothetical protein